MSANLRKLLFWGYLAKRWDFPHLHNLWSVWVHLSLFQYIGTNADPAFMESSVWLNGKPVIGIGAENRGQYRNEFNNWPDFTYVHLILIVLKCKYRETNRCSGIQSFRVPRLSYPTGYGSVPIISEYRLLALFSWNIGFQSTLNVKTLNLWKDQKNQRIISITQFIQHIPEVTTWQVVL